MYNLASESDHCNLTIRENWRKGVDRQPPTPSRLLVLPVEIRRIIFGYLIGGTEIQISEDSIRATGTTLLHRDPTRSGIRTGTFDQDRNEEDEKQVDVLYTMLICQQLYSEVTDMLYMTSRFIFHDAIAFLRFSSRLSPAILRKLRFFTIDAGFGGCSFFESPLRSWPDVEKGHEDAYCLPSLAAHYYNEPYYPSLLSRLFNKPRYHYDFQNPQVPSTWGAVCQDLAKMKGLVFLHVRVALTSMLVCYAYSAFYEGRGLNVDHGQAEPFILEPLITAKQELGKESDVTLTVDWIVLGGHIVFGDHSISEERARRQGLVVERTQMIPVGREDWR